MVYFEVININWKRVEQKLDITGDGKFDQDDIEVGTRAFLRILTQVKISFIYYIDRPLCFRVFQVLVDLEQVSFSA